MNDESDSITQWIAKLSNGDEQAAHVIWERYFEQLVRYARRRLENAVLQPDSTGASSKIVPKGLRSFDAEDADRPKFQFPVNQDITPLPFAAACCAR